MTRGSFLNILAQMNIHVFKNYAEMSDGAAAMLVSLIRTKNKSLVCLPSGDTPTLTLRRLVEMARQGAVDFTNTTFVGLDEWVGMDKDDPGSCQHYVYNHFFYPADIPSSRIVFFDAKAKDPGDECRKVANYLRENGPLDVVLVGVGMNGHIGLNEPGVEPDLDAHVVTLEKTTKEVAQKYFTESKTLEKGITLGLAQIMAARTVIVIANGLRKADIIQKIVEGPVSRQVPGTILQEHPSCHFFVDEDAASQLTAAI